jgi:hypothetical protein
MTLTFGELKKANVRDYWKNEEYDFTPWLAEPENMERLGAAVGLELELEAVETSCGPYWADILAKESGSDRYVIIENQFGKTNHDHLGKLITYGAVLDAGTVIWISEVFTDEHQKALDWLNDHSTDDGAFYGVSIELWQIDGSPPAVRFNVVSRPSEAVRRATKQKETSELSESRKLQLDFWCQVRDKLLNDKVVSSTQSPRPQNCFHVSLGRSGIFLSNTASVEEKKITVRLYLINRVAETAIAQLSPQREEIERELGESLQWNPFPEKRDKIVALTRDVDLLNQDLWPDYVKWMVDHIRRFREVFGPRVKKLDLRQVSSEENELDGEPVDN